MLLEDLVCNTEVDHELNGTINTVLASFELLGDHAQYKVNIAILKFESRGLSMLPHCSFEFSHKTFRLALR